MHEGGHTDRIDVALTVVRGDRGYLVAVRPEGSHLAGSWEFPGGKVERGEEPIDAARRELHEETGLTAEQLQPLVVVMHDYPERSVRLHVYHCTETRGELRLDRTRQWGWMSYAELQSLKMPAANAEILRALRWRER